jgi:hypothetical protein
MNKKIILFIPLNLILFAIPVYAQRQVQDYTFQYEKYRTAYDEFTVSKNEFIKQKTLTSQKDALEKTKAILSQRAVTLRTYLMATKYSLNTTPGIPNDDKTRISANLDKEIGWLQNHIDDLSGMGNPTLTDLFEISSRLERKQGDYVTIAHEAVAHLLIGRLRQTNQEFSATNANLQPLVEKYKNSFIRNWYDQAVDMSYRCDQSITNALALTKGLENEEDEEQAVDSLAKVKAELEKGKQNLRNGVGYQHEILKELNKMLPKPTVTAASQSGVTQ